MSEHHASGNSLETPFDLSDCTPRQCKCGATVYDAPPLAGLLPMEKDGRTHSTLVCEVRTQLAEAQKENATLTPENHALRRANAALVTEKESLASDYGGAVEHAAKLRREFATALDRLTACEPVLEAVRESSKRPASAAALLKRSAIRLPWCRRSGSTTRQRENSGSSRYRRRRSLGSCWKGPSNHGPTHLQVRDQRL